MIRLVVLYFEFLNFAETFKEVTVAEGCYHLKIEVPYDEGIIVPKKFGRLYSKKNV